MYPPEGENLADERCSRTVRVGVALPGHLQGQFRQAAFPKGVLLWRPGQQCPALQKLADSATLLAPSLQKDLSERQELFRSDL